MERSPVPDLSPPSPPPPPSALALADTTGPSYRAHHSHFRVRSVFYYVLYCFQLYQLPTHFV